MTSRLEMSGPNPKTQKSEQLEPGEYMAFGLGKDDARSDMANADATVTWVDRSSGQVHAVDYFLSFREQVSRSTGDNRLARSYRLHFIRDWAHWAVNGGRNAK